MTRYNAAFKLIPKKIYIKLPSSFIVTSRSRTFQLFYTDPVNYFLKQHQKQREHTPNTVKVQSLLIEISVAVGKWR